MGISKRPHTCIFCGSEDGYLAFLANDDEDKRGEPVARRPLTLCKAHQAILEHAGAKGRVYKGDGKRWWLWDFRVGK